MTDCHDDICMKCAVFLQRLHRSHAQPQGDLATRYERGYCIYLAARDDSTAGVEALDALAAVVNHMQPEARPQGSTPVPLPGQSPAVPHAAPATSSHSGTPTVQPPPQVQINTL